MPKVSVLIPVFGVEKYIERCAISLFEQTLDDIEYLFIDDCTTDGSVKILRSVLEKYPNRKEQVHIHQMEKNSGQAKVREWGINNVSGEYVIHCDSDDWVEPDAYQLLYEKAVADHLDIVCCGYYRSNGKEKTAYKSGFEGLVEKDDFFKHLLTYRAMTSVWSKLVRRELYTENEIKFPTNNMWEDFALNVQLFYYAKKIGVVEKPLYNYFTNPGSISYSNIDKRQRQIIENSKLILEFLKEKGVDNIYAAQIVFFKYMSRSELVNHVANKSLLKVWKETYPEVNRLFWKCSEFSLKEKVKFLSIYFGLYQYFFKFKYHYDD